MIAKKNFIFTLLLFLAIRLFSFLFTPQTPLLNQNAINNFISIAIFLITLYFLIKKSEYGWYIILTEIILGGSGGYFQIFGTALRTCLLIFSLVIFFWQNRKQDDNKEKNNKFIWLLLIAAGGAAATGLITDHSRAGVYADFVPYLFLLYYFPLRELLHSEKFRALAFNLIFAAIVGNAFLILFTQAGFSFGIFAIQDNYYHWYRDVALGKITDLGMNFYRLVLNEHLLLIPLTIYFLGDAIKNKLNTKNIVALVCLLIILANNLTRIYLVGLAAGTLALFYHPNWKRWLVASASVAASFLIIFTGIHLLATHGKSLGWEFFGLRLQSIATPQIEDSSLSRMLLLPKILEKIKQHPFVGSGLGDTVTVYSPIFKQNITTPHFDWGYLEIYAEMGLLGALAWLLLIFFTFKKLIKNSQHIMFAILISFLVINITSPALFHVFGITLLIIILNHAWRAPFEPRPHIL